MTYYSRRRRRRTSRGSLVLLLVLVSVFLVSCVAGSNPLWVRGLFGLDVASYRSEVTVRELAVDGKTSAELCDMVEILVLGDTELKPFSSTSQAVKLYRDAILNDMLRDDYLHYAGAGANLSIERGAVCAPTLSVMIPSQDFENTVYRYFGGTAVQHRDGEVFEYVRAAKGYTAPVSARSADVEVDVISLEETEHTYRMTFCLWQGDVQSEIYRACFVKREDTSCYFYALELLS